MKQLGAICLVFACASIAESDGLTITAAAPLAGCWEGTLEPGTQEQWMAPAGGMMLGMSRTVRTGNANEFEFLRIIEDQGKVMYIAKPSGQPEAAFTLVKSSAKELVFENPEHDFPQRIRYTLSGKNILTARIEGKNEGKDLGIDSPMKRVPCP